MSPFTRQKSQSVAAWGEIKLIAEIRRWLGSSTPQSPAGIGDDCAVMSGSLRDQLVTVDPVIFGHHFDESIPAQGAAAKLFNRNLSDIAAMGGRPRAAVVALAMSPTVKIEWLQEFYRELATISRRHRVPVIGGDVATQNQGFCATMTVLGEASAKGPINRIGAQEGDWIFVTGRLGGSRLGWHWKFRPRLAEAQWLATRLGIRSMTDISDGLAKDIWSLTPKGCRPALSTRAIPLSPSAHIASQKSGQTPLAHALTDGEDYELLFTMSRNVDPTVVKSEWRSEFNLRLTMIGCFETKRSRTRFADTIELADYHGFEHLR
jgi:thiamine-monophosphate kinase